MSFYFVPDSFVLTEELKDFARNLGLTDGQIDEQEDKWRDYQYKRAMRCPVRCWRNWVRNAIKFGDVTPTRAYKPRQVQELTDAERKADAAKAWAELNRLKGVK